MIPTFELSRPETLHEAARQVSAGGVPYAGGTELVAAMGIGLVAPSHLVDLKRVPELRGVSPDGGDLVIGAATRHEEVAASPDVGERAPILAAACTQLGNMRVRATGTIGGNACFADPRSDVTTALFALGARMSLYSVRGRRTVPVTDFVLGAMEADRADDELLTAIHIPAGDRYYAYVRHQPAEYPTVCVAMTVPRTQPEGPVTLVVGAVGERPQLVTVPGLDATDLDAVAAGLDVIGDLNGSEDYKRHLAGVVIRRAASRLREVVDA